MSLDYGKLGFKCGIEIHQQLDTHKLFCSCPSVIREENPDLVVERRMRAVAGELGVVDPAALHEFLKNRRLVYEAYSDTNCLVELDEEPPHPLNQEALDIAVEVALLLKAKLVDELQVMRKTVIDGSNTTGFQRTVLVAMDGSLETSEGVIGIPTVCLEEDAARKIMEEDNTVTYRLDRLGIPLVEVATTPDIKNPVHAREVAEKIGMLLRATGKVKRGLGTIRQDINVSITAGARVEVKGVQDLKTIPRLIENEVRRQLALVEIKKELSSRRISDKDLKEDYVEVSDVFAMHGKEWIKNKISSGEKVFALKLKGFRGILGKQLMPDYRFGTELARIAKSTTGLGGIIHSDENLDVNLRKQLEQKLNTDKQTAFVCVVASKEKAGKTLETILKRCATALKGVPEETRNAAGEITEYMRPLPGSARMYPETDEPLVLLKTETVNRIKSSLPELFEAKAERYEKWGLSGELASQMSKSKVSGGFEGYVKKYTKLKPSVIAAVLLMAPKEAGKRFNADVDVLGEGHYTEILGLLEKGLVTRDSVVELIAEAAGSPDRKVAETAKEKKLTVLTGREVEAVVDSVLRENRELAAGKKVDVLLGRVMGSCRGRADLAVVRRMLAEKLA